jgi:MFS superfamily sulfate permease-like transporter
VLTATVLAGVLQIGMGFFGAGVTAYFLPSSMIKGILASIGLILILNQLPHAFGFAGQFGLEEAAVDSHIIDDLRGLVGQISLGATLITVLSLITLLLWDRPALKAHLVLKLIPAALVAVVLATGLNQLFLAFFPTLALRGERLVQLPVPQSLPELMSFFRLPDFSVLSNPGVYTVALSIAFVASLESLLSTEAGDKLDPYKRKTPTNHELKAQGLGNIVAGLIGGIPVTAVIVRTSANVSAGRSVNIDDDVLEIIEEFKKTAECKNIELEFVGFEKTVEVEKQALRAAA